MGVNSAYQLFAMYGETTIGKLIMDKDTGTLSLAYEPSWQLNGFAISPALSLDNQHTSFSAYNYLDNCLPEGIARQVFAQDIGVSEKNVYAQIRSLGQDLSGAILFQPSCDNEQHEPTFRAITEQELIYRLDQNEPRALIKWDNKPRLSVAGVQSKLNVFVNVNEDIGFGDGSLCSTHILKFEHKECQHLVINEYFCMRLSKAVGLPTADVTFTRFGKHPALLVDRFDRKYNHNENRVYRRHVIDGCQALNLPREYKYERNLGDGLDVKHICDGASLIKLFDFCQQSSSPAENTLWLINWQLFNLMINNFDSHGKNVSFYFAQNSVFTPAYDLVNVSMFEQFNHTLAMGMGDEFDPNIINGYQLADFAESCGLSRKLVAKLLTRLAKQVITILDSDLVGTLKEQSNLNEREHKYLQHLNDNIRVRTQHLMSQVSEMITIEL